MWIVVYALMRPISIVAMAALMMLLGVVAFFAMPKDIFPAVDIPEVNVVWYYPGMSADLIFDSKVVKVSPSARVPR
jgi:multidrug efflux pump subunit AcrB